MGRICLETFIAAPPEKCFDLSRSVDAHVESASSSGEKVVAGVLAGLMNLGDEVTWEATHFGIRQRLTVKMTALEFPTYFKDSQVRGIFKRFDHEHFFEKYNDGTLMRDVFDFECPYGVFGRCADFIVTRHLRRFLIERNSILKKPAEKS